MPPVVAPLNIEALCAPELIAPLRSVNSSFAATVPERILTVVSEVFEPLQISTSFPDTPGAILIV